MKKLLLLFVLLSLSLPSFAVSYRGMFDLSAGILTAGKKDFTYSGVPMETKPFMGGVFSMTHGCQIMPFLFAGVGVGVNLDFTEFRVGSDNSKQRDLYAVTLPIFLDLRWDLDIRKKITPFVDLKIGYQINVGADDNCWRTFGTYEDEYGYLNYTYAEVRGANSFYFQPTVGVRFKGGKRSGFNLGISYNAQIKRELYVENHFVGSANDGALMLNIGFDY